MVKKTKKQKLVLFDAHAIIHRAYHALPEFSTAKGEPTGGLYGVAAMLMKIISELAPDYMAACYDLPGKTFRHEAYKEYKAGRAKADDALVSQIIRSRDIFRAFSIPIVEVPGFEADDCLGSIVEQFKKEKNLEIIIASGDMDTLQLVSGDQVQVYTLRKGIQDTILYNEEKVRERFGFLPRAIPDYKGLAGDPSDNIIGIKGIGDKTATTLVTLFGTVEGMYAALKKNPNILTEKGLSPRISELVRLGEEEALFSKTLATIRHDAPTKFVLPQKTWNEVKNKETIQALFQELEFRSLEKRLATLFGESTTEKKDEEKEIPEENVPMHDIRETGIALWLLNSSMTNPSLEDILSFARTKVFVDAKKKIFEALKKEPTHEVFEKIEQPLLPIVEKAEKRGICVDKKYTKDLSVRYHKVLAEIEKEIYTHAGKEFNINSPRQLGEIIFDHLNLSVKGLKKTEGGARSTRESELVKLKDTHPIIEAILRHREIQKLLSTYIDAIPNHVDTEGKVHTRLNQSGAATGRFSSQNPNLQNIPAKDAVREEIRNMFVASPGHTFLLCDYSQIEMRILAAITEDPGLIKTFKEGKDVHSSVASRVFGVPEEEVTKDMRRKAKVINFGIIYGMGVNALRENLGGDRKEAQEFYDNYFKTFPTIAAYFERVKKEAHKKGYTETYFGRRCFFEGIDSSIPYIRAAAERQALNAPIQGTAADIIKIAMKNAEEALRDAGILKDVHLVLQVHDELMYEVSDAIIPKAAEIIKKAMEEGANPSWKKQTFPVPVTVNVSSGKRWGDAQPL